MDRNLLLERHPVLYHMAEDGMWPSIQRHGLLSTRALVELFDPPAEVREEILRQVRRTSRTLEHAQHGKIIVRDQGPLKFLANCLHSDTTPEQFLDALNGRVFLWMTRERLLRLLNGKRYRKLAQTILQLDTAAVLDRYGDVAQLAPYNTGSMHVPTAPKRGVGVFTSIDDYPYDAWRKARGPRQDAVVEFTVPNAMPDAAELTLRVERWIGGNPERTLYARQ